MTIHKIMTVIIGLVAWLFVTAPAPAAIAATASTTPNQTCPPATANWSSSYQWTKQPFTGTDGSQYTLNANQWGTDGSNNFTLFTTRYKGQWGFCSQSMAGPGWGWPYANEEKDYNGKPISSIKSLVSTFQFNVPSGYGQWNVAYDIGINGEVSQGGNELMIWLYTHGQGTGNVPRGTIRIDRTNWNLSTCTCHRLDVTPPHNTTVGNVNVLDIIHALAHDKRSASYIPSGSRLYGVQFGSEVHGTQGQKLTFLYLKYTLTP